MLERPVKQRACQACRAAPAVRRNRYRCGERITVSCEWRHLACDGRRQRPTPPRGTGNEPIRPLSGAVPNGRNGGWDAPLPGGSLLGLGVGFLELDELRAELREL